MATEAPPARVPDQTGAGGNTEAYAVLLHLHSSHDLYVPPDALKPHFPPDDG